MWSPLEKNLIRLEIVYNSLYVQVSIVMFACSDFFFFSVSHTNLYCEEIMKTLLCLLLFSTVSFSQTKNINTQRYQIVECSPISGQSAVFLIDGETGRTWQLGFKDSLPVASKNGTFTEPIRCWIQIPVERGLSFNDPIREFYPDPEEKKK